MSEDELPRDVIVNIASRLPAKSVGRCRCISKSWCTSLSDPFFVRKHLNESNQRHISRPEFVFTMQKVANEDRLGFFMLDCNQLFTEHEFVELDNPFKDFCCEYSLRVLGSCDGIVCLAHLCADIICLWNPCTGEYMKLPDPFSVKKSFWGGQAFHWVFSSGFGFCYNSVSNDYEIVRISLIKADDRSTFHYVADVYSLGKNTCRRFGGFLYGSMIKPGMGHMVSGALHWTGYLAVKTSSPPIHAIFAFNIGSREFKEVPLPKYGASLVIAFAFEVNELRGKLYLVRGDTHYIDVWVMQDYGVAESWNKLHVLYPHDFVLKCPPMPFLDDKGCVLTHHGVKIVLFHTDDQFEVKLFTGQNKVFVAGTYTESLLRFNVDIRVGYKSTFTIPSEKQVLTYQLVKRFQAGSLIQLPPNDVPLRYSLLVEENNVFTCEKLLIDE